MITQKNFSKCSTSYFSFNSIVFFVCDWNFIFMSTNKILDLRDEVLSVFLEGVDLGLHDVESGPDGFCESLVFDEFGEGDFFEGF